MAERGPAQSDLEQMFAALTSDSVGEIDGVGDVANQPLAAGPASVRADLADARIWSR